MGSQRHALNTRMRLRRTQQFALSSWQGQNRRQRDSRNAQFATLTAKTG